MPAQLSHLTRIACAATLAVTLSAQLPTVLAQQAAPSGNGPHRRLAPGVIIEIPAQIEEQETYSGPREMTELLAIGGKRLDWTPHTLAKSETLLAMARNATFRRSVWGLEIGFKPLRMIEIEQRLPDGSVVPQKVYYLVYYVKNNGRHLSPDPQPDAHGNVTFATKPVNHTIRFFPSFVLQAHDADRAYLDVVLPAAVEQIRRREDASRNFMNSVSISSQPIPISSEYEDNSVWGIATWTNVDPRSDFFSIFIQGLTNAYRWQDPEGAFQVGDPPMTGRRFTYKTLQLNFWRAGDAIDPTEDEIRFGVPNQNQVPAGKTEDEILRVYRLQERVDYLWVYR
jgi:hypothetical protein